MLQYKLYSFLLIRVLLSSFFDHTAHLLQHLLLEIQVGTILHLLLGLVGLFFLLPLAQLFFLLLLLQIALSHEDHLFLDAQFLVLSPDLVLVSEFMTFLPFAYQLFHFIDVL